MPLQSSKSSLELSEAFRKRKADEDALKIESSKVFYHPRTSLLKKRAIEYAKKIGGFKAPDPNSIPIGTEISDLELVDVHVTVV